MSIIPISIEDYSNIVALVNAAYRGEASNAGWTSEAHLLLGDKRIDKTSLETELNVPGTTILKMEDEDHQLLGCVLLRLSETGLYLGMLSVWPQLQTLGAGKQLMQAAEQHALQHGCNRMYLTVISVRKELIAWYERRGYAVTGEIEPFPKQAAFGAHIQPLEFVVMEKVLAY